ncbi:HepT-like ribonuclease domain-containing protein [Mesorhizobium sp. BAC0120]|uniref:HepT-like ribonuclease domain-containing protein n=1 Tax=Mesorhizobium sp. BAC0120 TaxID=3090670 RepID=UPI00298CA3F0|nr:HepT-like ribonuclease domain-containing protein [Mesorhizobium sp. BAC0120]MDW6020724.1 HepT-like ribonuclease domain-containing protein [Mesorhizobium sp. BAC0120]
MPSRDTRRVLAAIAYNVRLAHRFVEGMSFEAFAEDERTLYAVTRCLEIISEASRRLPSDLKARHPNVPWAQIAGAGNIYRHDYEDVLARILWITVREQLDALEHAVAQEQST